MADTRVLKVVRDPATTDLPFTGPKKDGDVGYDLPVTEETAIPPGAHLPPTDVPCGLRVQLPPGTFGLIVSRSGTHGRYPTLRLCNAPLDNGYIGPIDPRFRNEGAEPVTVPRGERLAQLVILPAVVVPVTIVESLEATERGTTGYGSTGK